MFDLNPWAVLVAALSSFLLGGLWYSGALFGRVWCREAGRDFDAAPAHPARVFAVSFLLAVASAAVFAAWLGPDASLADALGAALLAGLGFVAASFGINYQFAERSLLMWAIDGGYHAAQFLLFGLVLGLWR